MKLSCRNCGDPVVDLETAVEAALREYNLPREVVEQGIRVWHPKCACSDGLLYDPSDVEEFYFDVHWSVRGHSAG